MRDAGVYQFWFTPLALISRLSYPLLMLLALFLRLCMACPFLLLPLKAIKPVLKCPHVGHGRPPYAVYEVRWDYGRRTIGVAKIALCKRCLLS